MCAGHKTSMMEGLLGEYAEQDEEKVHKHQRKLSAPLRAVMELPGINGNYGDRLQAGFGFSSLTGYKAR